MLSSQRCNDELRCLSRSNASSTPRSRLLASHRRSAARSASSSASSGRVSSALNPTSSCSLFSDNKMKDAMNTVGLAKAIMKLSEARPPSPLRQVGALQEVFRHDCFVRAGEAERRAIMLASSQTRYAEELAYPLDNYFGVDLTRYLSGREALDLGCFTGGRSVAYFERYQFKRLLGIDVAPEFIEAATQFAQSKRVDASFEVARGETLPLASQSVDAILSFDVFEHVQNLRQTLQECQRVLRPGGRLLVVFPSYYQPVEHHLSLVTRLPGLQYLFS